MIIFEDVQELVGQENVAGKLDHHVHLEAVLAALPAIVAVEAERELREVVAVDGEAVGDVRELVPPLVHAPGAATTRAAQKRVEPTLPLKRAPRLGDHAGPRRRHSRLAEQPAAASSLAMARPGLLLRLRQRQGAALPPAQVRGGFGPQEAQPRPRHGQGAEMLERPMAAPIRIPVLQGEVRCAA